MFEVLLKIFPPTKLFCDVELKTKLSDICVEVSIWLSVLDTDNQLGRDTLSVDKLSIIFFKLSFKKFSDIYIVLEKIYILI